MIDKASSLSSFLEEKLNCEEYKRVKWVQKCIHFLYYCFEKANFYKRTIIIRQKVLFLNRKFKKEELSKLHHQLVLFGRYYCKAVKPECGTCKIKDLCKEKRKNI